MRIDCEIEGLSEMPADSIGAAIEKAGISARPADSSTMRLHHSCEYAEGGNGSSWHFSDEPISVQEVRSLGWRGRTRSVVEMTRMTLSRRLLVGLSARCSQ